MMSMYVLHLHVEFIEISHSSVCKHGSFTDEQVHKALYMIHMSQKLPLQGQYDTYIVIDQL